MLLLKKLCFQGISDHPCHFEGFDEVLDEQVCTSSTI